MGVLLLAAIFGFLFLMSAMDAFHDANAGPRLPFPLPPFEAAVGILMLFHLIMVLFSFTSTPSLFRDADANFLFPSPLDPFTVIRSILLNRGMFLLGAFLLYAGFYFSMFGARTAYALKAILTVKCQYGMIVYLLMIFLVATGILFLSTYIGFRAFRKKYVWQKFWAAFLCVLAVPVYLLWNDGLRSMHEGHKFLAGFINGLEEPAPYWLLLPLRGLTDAAVLTFNGWTSAICFGFAFWFIVLIVSHELLRRSTPFLYEYASFRAQNRPLAGFGRSASWNDVRKRWLEKVAKQGTLQKRKIPLLDQWTPQGAGAIFWRDLIIYWRQHSSSLITLCCSVAVLPLAIRFFTPDRKLERILFAGYTIAQSGFVMLFFTTCIMSLVDSLKKIDIQKALPLTGRTILLFESLPALLVIFLLELVLAVIALGFAPQYWDKILFYCFVSVSFVPVMNMALVWFMLTNPDTSDPIQRILHGALLTPFFIGPLVPGGVVLVALLVMKTPLVLTAVIVIAANALLWMLLMSIVGRKYENFNPTD